MSTSAEVDLRATMGHFASGVTVVTAGGAAPCGSTVSAVTSVSLAPPLLLVCLRNESRTLAALRATGRFGVNVLSAGQQRLAHHFAQRDVIWDEVDWHPGPATEAPLLGGAGATLECAVHDVADGGDHRIVVGRVLATDHPCTSAVPLLVYRGAFAAIGL